MAESTNHGGSHVNDFLKQKRMKLAAQEGQSPNRLLKRRPARPAPAARPVKDTLGLMSSSRFAGQISTGEDLLIRRPKPAGAVRRPVPGARPMSKPAVGSAPVTGEKKVEPRRFKIGPDGKKIYLKRRKLTPEEIEAKRLKKEAEANLSEEEKLQREKEAELKRIEDERLKAEEEERKRVEAEARLQQEKEAEAQRLEDEKIRKEHERERIFKKIEHYRHTLTTEEKVAAEKIASEMVRRNIKWDGYISLSSGIGGAMLRDHRE